MKLWKWTFLCVVSAITLTVGYRAVAGPPPSAKSPEEDKVRATNSEKSEAKVSKKEMEKAGAKARAEAKVGASDSASTKAVTDPCLKQRNLPQCEKTKPTP